VSGKFGKEGVKRGTEEKKRRQLHMNFCPSTLSNLEKRRFKKSMTEEGVQPGKGQLGVKDERQR